MNLHRLVLVAIALPLAPYGLESGSAYACMQTYDPDDPTNLDIAECIPAAGGGVDCGQGVLLPACAWVVFGPSLMSTGYADAECDIPGAPTKCVGTAVFFAGGELHGSIAIPGPDGRFDGSWSVGVAAGAFAFSSIISDRLCPDLVCATTLYGDANAAITIQRTNGDPDYTVSDACPRKYSEPPANKACIAAAMRGSSNNDECMARGVAYTYANNGAGTPLSLYQSTPNAACVASAAAFLTPGVTVAELNPILRQEIEPLIRDSIRSMLEEHLPRAQNEMMNEIRAQLIAEADAAAQSAMVRLDSGSTA